MSYLLSFVCENFVGKVQNNIQVKKQPEPDRVLSQLFIFPFPYVGIVYVLSFALTSVYKLYRTIICQSDPVYYLYLFCF